MADKPKRSIPSWQQATSDHATETSAGSSESPNDLLDLAQEFLKDDSIRNAPRHDKVEYLKEKGLSDGEIEKLLAQDTTLAKDASEELKTIHDTAGKPQPEQSTAALNSSTAPNPQSMNTIPKVESRPEIVPVITYPEFLLKPQKPPPLITISRLIDAAYAIAGVSALTWGASKYIVEPMLHTLTEARTELADTTLVDLEKFNQKLEGMVSHVPYIASTALKKAQDHEEDSDSIVSDPTELFHRDFATQTTPSLSRSTSDNNLNRHTLDPTIAQAERLSGLSYSLRSFVQSLNHSNDNEKHLQGTMKEFQEKLDTFESSYSLLKNDYYSSTSTYSSASGDAKKVMRDNEAQKFKQEIRSLKGAFLSSRNFATAPRATAVASGHTSR